MEEQNLSFNLLPFPVIEGKTLKTSMTVYAFNENKYKIIGAITISILAGRYLKLPINGIIIILIFIFGNDILEYFGD